MLAKRAFQPVSYCPRCPNNCGSNVLAADCDQESVVEGFEVMGEAVQRWFAASETGHRAVEQMAATKLRGWYSGGSERLAASEVKIVQDTIDMFDVVVVGHHPEHQIVQRDITVHYVQLGGEIVVTLHIRKT